MGSLISGLPLTMEIRLLKRTFNFADYPSYIWIAFFYSLLPVFDLVQYADLRLASFYGQMVGIATIEGVDIGARVRLYYLAILLLILTFSALMLIGARYSRKLGRVELDLLNMSALGGACLLLFRLLGAEVTEPLHFIHALHVIFVVGFGFGMLFKKSTLSISTYALVIGLSICGSFLFMEMGVRNSLPFTTAGIGILVLLVVMAIDNWRGLNLDLLGWRLKPLALVPFLSFFSLELALILKHRGTGFSEASFIYVLGLIFILLLCFRGSFGIKAKVKPLKQILNGFYFPWILVGAMMWMHYDPLAPHNGEMFELANKVLPIQQFYEFGRLPLLETLNAHLLSDIVPGFLYTILHGYYDLHFLNYMFLFKVVSMLLGYFLLLRITGSPYPTLFILLLVPFVDMVIRTYFMTTLISVFVLWRLTQNPSRKNYLLFVATGIFLLLWRLDIGYANILASLGLLLAYRWKNDFIFSFRKFGFALTVLLGPLSALVGIIAIWKGIAIPDRIAQAFHYFMSSQSYGYPTVHVAWDITTRAHYFLFPFLGLILTAYLVSGIRKSTSDQAGFTLLAVLYLILFYLANFPRGLVRHSFVENTDLFLGSTLCLGLSAVIYILWQNRDSFVRFLGFLSIAAGLSYLLSPNEPGQKKDLFSELSAGSRPEPYEMWEAAARSEDVFADQVAEQLKSYLMDRGRESTFLDFTNSPMLYYYTHSRHPGYFSQTLLCAHDEYLQKAFLKSLADEQASIVVYSSIAGGWGDQVDGVPNQIRHYKIAEYIYQNYRPDTVFDDYDIWQHSELNESRLDSQEILWHDVDFYVGDLPYLSAKKMRFKRDG